MGLLMNAALAVIKVDPVQSAPLELSDGTFLLGAMGNLYRFEQRGQGRLENAVRRRGVRIPPDGARPDVVYVGAEESSKT